MLGLLGTGYHTAGDEAVSLPEPFTDKQTFNGETPLLALNVGEKAGWGQPTGMVG